MSVISNIWNWIVGKKEIIAELKPVVDEGEAIIAGLQELMNDIKGGRLGETAEDAAQIAQDVQDFAAAVQKIVADLQADPANAHAFRSGRIDRKSKVSNQHNNRMKSPPGGGRNDKHK